MITAYLCPIDGYCDVGHVDIHVSVVHGSRNHCGGFRVQVLAGGWVGGERGWEGRGGRGEAERGEGVGKRGGGCEAERGEEVGWAREREGVW